MMDIKEIIKWFIPCFHILLCRKKYFSKMFVICIFLFLNLKTVSSMQVNSVVSENSLIKTKNVLSSPNYGENKNISKSVVFGTREQDVQEPRTLGDTSVGRTFGRPFKKMIAGLLPIIFQIGAASTWALIAALVGLKTLLVATVILKILLVAGAAKLGALFANKQPHHGWEPPHPHQKEIHLHIHNGGHEHDEHLPVSSWSREGYPSQDPRIAYVYDPPYRAGPVAGPQTISTPFGNYVKIDTAPSSVSST